MYFGASALALDAKQSIVMAGRSFIVVKWLRMCGLNFQQLRSNCFSVWLAHVMYACLFFILYWKLAFLCVSSVSS